MENAIGLVMTGGGARLKYPSSSKQISLQKPTAHSQ